MSTRRDFGATCHMANSDPAAVFRRCNAVVGEAWLVVRENDTTVIRPKAGGVAYTKTGQPFTRCDVDPEVPFEDNKFSITVGRAGQVAFLHEGKWTKHYFTRGYDVRSGTGYDYAVSPLEDLLVRFF